MTSSVLTPVAEASKNRSTNFLHFISSHFYLLPLAAFWFLLIYHLGVQWSLYEQYNYGWAVPFLCCYLIWRRIAQRRGEREEGRGKSTEGRAQMSDFRAQAADL